MRSAHRTPDWACNTTPGAQLGQHVPAHTPDEQLVVAYLTACVCCWQLQLYELTAVAQAIEAPEPLSLEQTLLVEARLDRCLLLAQTMQEAGYLIQRFIIAAAPHIQVGFSLQGTVVSLPLYEEACAETHRVHRYFLRVRSGTADLRSRVVDYASRAGDVRRAVMRLWATLSDPALPTLSWETILPEEELTQPAQATDDTETSDPATFSDVARLFELWGAPTTSALMSAGSCLRHEPPAVLGALGLVHRAADLVRFSHRLLDLLPRESLSPFDPLQVHVETGRLELAQMQPISYQPALEFYEALVQVLVVRDVLTPDAALARQAQQIAAILLPNANHPQTDVAALCRAALLLDDRLALWQQQALALTGGRETIHDLLFPLLHEALEALANQEGPGAGEKLKRRTGDA